MCRWFQSWGVRHVKRDADMVVHRLSNKAIQQSLEQIWMKEYPTFIHDIVCTEKAMLI